MIQGGVTGGGYEKVCEKEVRTATGTKSTAAARHLYARTLGVLRGNQAGCTNSGRTISEELVWRAALSLEGAEARALLNVISGEIELAKATTSKHAPEDTRAREATCRVLAAIAHHLLPECQWVGIGMGVGPEDKPWFKVKVLTSTFPSTLSAEEATK